MSDQILFKKGQVQITPSLVVINNNAYPVHSIVSFTPHKETERLSEGGFGMIISAFVVLVAVGLVGGVFVNALIPLAMIIFLIIVGITIRIMFIKPKEFYFIYLNMVGEQKVKLPFQSLEDQQEAFLAISEAMNQQ